MSYAPREGLQNRIGSHLIGCWVAVLGTALAVAVGFSLYVMVQESGPHFIGALIVGGLPALLVASVLTALGLLVFGLPATWLLARLDRESGLAYLLAGTTAGAGLRLDLSAGGPPTVRRLMLLFRPPRPGRSVWVGFGWAPRPARGPFGGTPPSTPPCWASSKLGKAKSREV